MCDLHCHETSPDDNGLGDSFIEIAQEKEIKGFLLLYDFSGKTYTVRSQAKPGWKIF